MKLASALSSQFDDGVRSRGAAYFRAGAVRIVSGSAEGVDARVLGSREYDVQLEWDGRSLALFCDCPHFEIGEPCKHLWATILASDAKDCFVSITRFNPKWVVFAFPDADEDGFVDEEEDEEGWEDSDGEEDDDEASEEDSDSPTRHFLPYSLPPFEVPASAEVAPTAS